MYWWPVKAFKGFLSTWELGEQQTHISPSDLLNYWPDNYVQRFSELCENGRSRQIKFWQVELTSRKPHEILWCLQVLGAFRLQKMFKIPRQKIWFVCENKNFRPAAVWKKHSRRIVFIRVLFHSDSKNILRKFDHSEVQPISFILCRHHSQQWKDIVTCCLEMWFVVVVFAVFPIFSRPRNTFKQNFKFLLQWIRYWCKFNHS